MQTIKVISNISYNSPKFFKSVINDLVKRNIIDWAYWIYHKADIDELKDHIHFVLKPAKRLDTSQLRNLFNEIDPKMPEKPLSCTAKWMFTNSLEDWLLYVVHDEGYLASKGQRRNIHYIFDDLCATDEDALRADWNAIDYRKFDRMNQLYNAVEKHIPFALLIQNGTLPIAQRSQYEYQYNALMQLKLRGEANRILSHDKPVDNDGVFMDAFERADDIEF